MADYRLYQAKISVLTPLHIGSGRELFNEYDYAIHGGQTWCLNEDALLEAQDLDDPSWADRLAEIPAQLLQERDFRPDSAFFRYVIRGTPRSNAPGAQVREQLKDVYDRPYLPGSSLKGALRTALGWKRWQALGLRPDVRNLKNRKREFAAQWYEQELFSEHSGKAPNKDTFRALQVADSAPVGADRLMLVNARVLNRGGGLGSPIELEAIRPDTVFEAEIKVDTALFSAWAKKHHLDLKGDDLLLTLPVVVREYAIRRLQRQTAWFEQISGAEKSAQYCRDLAKTALPSGAFFLQIGWGGGWESKTFGDHLQADQQFMESILRPPREGGYGLARGRRKPGDPFPKSRRVLVQVQRAPDGQTHETPLYPLGWVLVEIR